MDATGLLLSFTPLDWSLLLVLLVSVVIGLWRGLVFEMMSLAAWVLAWWGASTWGLAAGDWAGVGAPDSMSRHLLGFAGAFIAIWLACAIAARLAKTLIAATPLGIPDRLLGAVFGLLRGLLLLLLAATLVAWTPIAQADWWRGARVVACLLAVQHGIQSWFPWGSWAAPAR
jgi:membrane protein required for colicin V production